MQVSKVRADHAKIVKLTDEKVALAEQAVRLVDKYSVRLQQEFERLQDMGYNIGDVETAYAAAATSSANAPITSAIGGLPAGLDPNASLNKKRKLPSSINTSLPSTPSSLSGMQATPAQLSAAYANAQMMGQNVNGVGASPTSAQIQALVAAQQQQQQHQHLQQLQAAQQAAMQNGGSPVNSAAQAQAVAAYMEQMQKLAGLTPAQQQAVQNHFAITYQNQYVQGNSPVAATPPPSLSASAGPSLQGAGNRPLRPSRLSSSFSALNGQQLQNAQNIQAGLPSANGAQQQLNTPTGKPAIASAAGGQKRARPPMVISTSTGAVTKDGPSARKKKRVIHMSDDESGSVDGATEEDGDAIEVDERKSSRKGKPTSRAGTPMTGAGSVGLASSLNPAHKKNNVGRAGRGSAIHNSAVYASGDAEEEDADGEVEEDWTRGNGKSYRGQGDVDAEGDADAEGELDEGDNQGEDRTLYCICQRVSQGNMIACDNPDCKYEWFHWDCVGITKQPDDKQAWYCPDCRAQMMLKSNTRQMQHGSGKGLHGIGKGNKLGGAASPYNQLAQQQQQMMLAAQHATQSGRASRRGQ